MINFSKWIIEESIYWFENIEYRRTVIYKSLDKKEGGKITILQKWLFQFVILTKKWMKNWKLFDLVDPPNQERWSWKLTRPQKVKIMWDYLDKNLHVHVSSILINSDDVCMYYIKYSAQFICDCVLIQKFYNDQA